MNRDEQKRWLWIFSTVLPLPDSVNEIVSVYSWLRLAFFCQCNLSLPHWRDYRTALAPASSTPRENVYIAFILDSHNAPSRTDEDRMQIPHPGVTSAEDSEHRDKVCLCLFVFLLPPRDVGFTPQTTLAATRPYKSLQRCTAVVTPLPHWLITPAGAVYHVFFYVCMCV